MTETYDEPGGGKQRESVGLEISGGDCPVLKTGRKVTLKYNTELSHRARSDLARAMGRAVCYAVSIPPECVFV